SKVMGVGDVVEPGYEWRPDRAKMKHICHVVWRPFERVDIPKQGYWPMVTVRDVSDELYRFIIGQGPAPATPEPPVGTVEEDKPYLPPQFDEILRGIHEDGMRVDEQTIRRYHLSLKTRGFVILSGLSGTGKTWLGQLYAKTVKAKSCIVAVAPNWTTNEDLLGYFNPLTRQYQTTEFSDFVRAAAEEYESAQEAGRVPRPYHLVLDEMNLARIEYYFAKFLSALEIRARHDVAVIDLGHGHSLTLTPNLFFIGTVNVDETTHGFADKVYDRAQLIEMPASRTAIFKHIDEVPWRSALMSLWDAVALVAPFAFRVVDEISTYIAEAEREGVSWEMALDEQILQKILPKFKGTDPRVGLALDQVKTQCENRFPLASGKA
ncbi:hypothetical protein EON80_30630, partial [bacterium]